MDFEITPNELFASHESDDYDLDFLSQDENDSWKCDFLCPRARTWSLFYY
jgi:hypothetical protein